MTAIPDPVLALPSITFDAGAVVIEEASPPGPLYFLAGGSVEVVKDDIRIAAISHRGAVFGEMSAMLNSPSTACVRALERSEFWCAENALQFLKAHPPAMLYVSEILAARLDALNRYLVDIKSQFREFDGHLSMVDEVLGEIMHRHPRKIVRRRQPEI